MEMRKKSLANELSRLGYGDNAFSTDSIPLIENILADLLQTTDSLKRYKDLSQSSLKTCHELETLADAYKKDNRKLTNAINQTNWKTLKRVKTLENDAAQLRARVKKLKTCDDKCGANVSRKVAAHSRREKQVAASASENDVSKLKERIMDLEEHLNAKNNYIEDCEREIHNLHLTLEGGRPVNAVLSDAEYDEYQSYETKQLMEKIDGLENKLKRTLNNYHEASKRAQQEGERSNILERELNILKKLRLSNLNGVDDTQMERFARMEEEISKLKSSNSAKSDNATTQCSCDAKNQGDNEAISLENATLSKLRTLCKGLEAEKSDLRNELSTMKTALDEKRTACEKLERELSEVKSAHRELIADSKDAKKRAREEMAKLQNRSNLIERYLTSENGRLGEVITIHRRHIAELEGKIIEISKDKVDKSSTLSRCLVVESKRLERRNVRSTARSKLDAKNKQNGNKENVEPPTSGKLADIRKYLKEVADRFSEQRVRPHSAGNVPIYETPLIPKKCEKCPLLENTLMDYLSRIQKMELEKEASTLLKRQNAPSGDVAGVQSASTNDGYASCANCRIVRTLETQIEMGKKRTDELERENESLRCEGGRWKTELMALCASVGQLEKEKTRLEVTIKEKSEEIERVRGLATSREEYCSRLEADLKEARMELGMALSTKIECEERAKLSSENARHLGEKIASLESAKEQAIAENRRLQNEISWVMKDCAAANVDLEKARKEARDMKCQIQDYIEKVRDAEETLRKKEMERSEMLEHLRSLTIETSHLGSDNSSLESEARSVRESLQEAQERVADLENILSNKDQLLNSYEQRVSELTRTVADLESRVARLTSQRDELQSDLKSCKDVADSLSNQRDMLSETLSSLNNSKERLREECENVREECESLRSQLEREKSSSVTLERLLSETRQETLQHSVISSDLKTDVDALKLKIRHLELSLDSTNNRLNNALKESDEQRQQIFKLERTLTNVRFEHARNSSSSGGAPANLSS